MEEIDIIDFFRYYLSKLFIVVAFIIFTFIIGNVYTMKIKTPLYRSDTTVILVSAPTEQELTQSELLLNKNLVKTYSNIVKSKKVLNKVISDLNLEYTYSELSKMIKVSNVDDTEIIKISVYSPDEENSAVIANSIVPVFSREVKRIYGIENVRVLDEATNSHTPCNINFVKENIIYLLIGIFLSSTLIFIMYYFDTSVKSSEMIEDKLGLTVIGVVPKVERRN